MGGASTQLIFHIGENSSSISMDDFWYLHIRTKSNSYNVRSHSWLNFGAEMVKDRIWANLRKSIGLLGNRIAEDKYINNPCTFEGFTETENSDSSLTMLGTGDPNACRQLIKDELWPMGCVEGPCSIDGIEHPPVTGPFYGMV